MVQGPRLSAGAIDLSQIAKQAEARDELQRDGFDPVISVTERDLDAKVLHRSLQVPVVLHVGSERSEDSQALRGVLTQLAQGQRGFVYAYVDADTAPQVAQALGVQMVPTVVALAAGRPVTSFQGNQPEEQLRQWVAALVKNLGPQLQGLPDAGAGAGDEDAAPEDPRLDTATAALNRGDFDAALAVYDEILAEDPANKEMKQAKATVGVIKRLDLGNRAEDPVAAADADADDVEKQLVAADAEVIAGAVEQAFDRLLRYVKQDPAAKARLLELFTLFDAGDPRVIRARTALASSLF